MSDVALSPGLQALADEYLESELTVLASRLWATTARFIELVGEFDRREGWAGWGCASAEWLSWQCGVAPGTARDQVRVARRLSDLPELARHATAGQLERIVGTYRRSQKRDDGSDAASFAERSARWHVEDDGSMVVTLRVPADIGALVVAAVEADASKLFEDDRGVSAETPGSGPDVSAETSEPRRSLTQRRSDTFVELVTTGQIGGSIQLSPDAARLLGCDAAVTAVIRGPNGEILDIGRRSRTVPRRLRRALERRDGGCIVDGCPRRAHLHAHHVVHWSQGGPTSLGNLALLCSFHHRVVHHGVLTIEWQNGRPRCLRGDGRSRRVVAPPTLDRNDLVDELSRLGVPTELESHAADGDRIDWGCAMAALTSVLRTTSQPS